ncbi:N-acetyl-gamma-glutamyl-phosphate reductase [Desulfovermiculus halophilus]|jgi:N-acetyl-gamma-glutamyl-phosphate reductase|uniref:N-acetyl-gamma-glutamyl-phosphate reductase n=1 Tax=Desulfovermiculus halophilus TaxID=339722 RepID=UPI000480B276|nr:N-acetyl-gamma-glutamyl-phosphate reductase [Desulfovermiculus halophilus]
MARNTFAVGLVGVTGYTGMEMLRCLLHHPDFELTIVTSRQEAGKSVARLFPQLAGTHLGQLTISEPDMDRLAADCDLVFLAVPHGTAMRMAAELIQRGVKVVDLSADFRLKSQDVFEQWYNCRHEAPDLLQGAVYGLPELYATEIAQARLVANPGCYPTSVLLGLFPALQAGLVHSRDIVADSKSGASGAGRGAKVGTLFCEVSDTFKAYGLGTHRHTPEIDQEVSRMTGQTVQVSFNPHLLPINRGILTTLYTTASGHTTLEGLCQAYEDFDRDHPWIRVQPQGTLPELKNVRGTMYCDIGLVLDQRTGRVIIVSVIDNLCRGASGQALANANLMCGLPLTAGLDLPALVP